MSTKNPSYQPIGEQSSTSTYSDNDPIRRCLSVIVLLGIITAIVILILSSQHIGIWSTSDIVYPPYANYYYEWDLSSTLSEINNLINETLIEFGGTPVFNETDDKDALVLTNKTYLVIPMNSSLNVTDYTLMAWILPNFTYAPTTNYVLWATDKSGQANSMVTMINATSITFYQGTTNSNATQYSLPAGIPWSNISFSHVAFKYNSTESVGSIYINGTKVANHTFGTAYPGFTSLQFGLTSGLSNIVYTNFTGELDCMFIWPRVSLSSSIIDSIYEEEAASDLCDLPESFPESVL